MCKYHSLWSRLCCWFAPKKIPAVFYAVFLLRKAGKWKFLKKLKLKAKTKLRLPVSIMTRKFASPALKSDISLVTIGHVKHFKVYFVLSKIHVNQSTSQHKICKMEGKEILTVIAMWDKVPRLQFTSINYNHRLFPYTERSTPQFSDGPYEPHLHHVSDYCFHNLPRHYIKLVQKVDPNTRQASDHRPTFNWNLPNQLIKQIFVAAAPLFILTLNQGRFTKLTWRNITIWKIRTSPLLDVEGMNQSSKLPKEPWIKFSNSLVNSGKKEVNNSSKNVSWHYQTCQTYPNSWTLNMNLHPVNFIDDLKYLTYDPIKVNFSRDIEPVICSAKTFFSLFDKLENKLFLVQSYKFFSD